MLLLPVWKHDQIAAYAKVDDDLYALANFRWYLHSAGYAWRFLPRNGGKSKGVLLHREILGLPLDGDGRQGDHINRDRLDNRRVNLRVVSGAQNSQNLSSRPGTSKHRGVDWIPKRRRWRASIQINRRPKTLGFFRDEAEAARVAASARARLMPYSEEALAR